MARDPQQYLPACGEQFFFRADDREKLVITPLLGGFVLIGVVLLFNSSACLGIGMVLTFGFVFIISFIGLLPGSTSLFISPDGFTVTTMYHSESIGWSEVSRFQVTSVRSSPMKSAVGFDINSTARTKRKRVITRILTGFDGALMESYDFKPDDLAILMNTWRDRFTDESGELQFQVGSRD